MAIRVDPRPDYTSTVYGILRTDTCLKDPGVANGNSSLLEIIWVPIAVLFIVIIGILIATNVHLVISAKAHPVQVRSLSSNSFLFCIIRVQRLF